MNTMNQRMSVSQGVSLGGQVVGAGGLKDQKDIVILIIVNEVLRVHFDYIVLKMG